MWVQSIKDTEHSKFIKLCLNEGTGAKARLSQVGDAQGLPDSLGMKAKVLDQRSRTKGGQLAARQLQYLGRWGYQVVLGALAGWVENSSESGAS